MLTDLARQGENREPEGPGDLRTAAFIVLTRSPAGRGSTVSEMNGGAGSLLRLSRDEALGAPFSDLVPESITRVVDEAVASVAASGTPAYFSLPASGDGAGSRQLVGGTVFPVSASSVAVILCDHAAAGPAVSAISKGKQEWERTVDAIDDIITIQDRQMRIIRANRAAHRLFGYEFGELIDRKCFCSFHRQDHPCPGCPVVATNADASFHRGYVWNDELKKMFDVSASPVFDDTGELSMIVHVARDVTDTIEQEEERKRLSTAIEQASEVIVVTDRGGVIQYVNPAFTASTGYTREEALGSNIDILRSDPCDARLSRQMWEQLLSGQVWRGNMVNRRKDGTTYSEMATISPVFDADGTISSFVAVKRDLSREEALERQLQQAIKLEAIGTMAGGIAHDFNNILSAILGYAHIAKGQLPATDATVYSINHIIAAGNRAAELIRQILTFSRQDNSKEPFRIVNLQDIIGEALKLLRPSLPATIKLTRRISSGCGPVMADAGQIHQVIMNLCTNARQAIGDQYGEISISLTEKSFRKQPQDKHYPALPPGTYAHLQVTDDGCGMDEQVQKRIFDPFFSTKPKEHGTGLGLSVVHGIVKNHDGTIGVVSEPGGGTIFHVFLPVAREPAVQAVEQPAVVRGGTEHILLVDDEVRLVEMLKVWLERLGYRVTPFTDSIEAVRHYRQHSAEFDAVITDMTMPNMTGSELSREILSLRPELPVILATGFSESIDKRKALRIGIRDFLIKPLSRETLACSLRQVLDHG